MADQTFPYQPLDHDPRSEAPPASFVLSRVDPSAPRRWLRSGLAVLRAAPGPGLLYGGLFALACLGTLYLTRAFPWFTLAFLTGLLLIGPFLAAGLYAAARDHGAGRRVSIRAGLALLWARRSNLSLFALFLALVMAAWVRFAALLFAIMDNGLSPSANSYAALLDGRVDPTLAVFFVGIGGLLAAVVFVTSAIAVPLIVDRDAGPITAITTSARAVSANAKAMLLWAALIVSLTLVGVLTWFVGLIVLFPVLGYATWASYRDLVE